MAEPRMNEVAQELLQRSRARKVPWEEKTRGRRSGQDAYQVVFPDGTIILTRGEGPLDPGGALLALDRQYDGYQLDLLSDTGRIIGSLVPKPDEPIYGTLAEIFDLAESYVRDRGINRALDFLKSR